MAMQASAWQTLGPFFDRQLIRAGNDLTRRRPDAPEALGPVIEIAGQVRQEDAAPVPGCLIELWQANAAGRYAHPADRSDDRPLDPNFFGFGRALTDPDGRYRFRTIKPGPVPHRGNQWQAPHILVSVFAAGLLRRLVTRLYFEGEPANETDPILATIEDPVARATLIARLDQWTPAPRYVFDIVLRGEGETAFFTD
jgi:protocatechuate 3,4-dioxygenase, alpha subunit